MGRQQPRLRNGVDLQLQSAFASGNWTAVVNLAEKRARTFQDQYFEVVKVCAESQLEDPNSKAAALVAVDRYVRAGTVIKDIEAIDLLEWATADLLAESEIPETLGQLRVRAVKASPRDKDAACHCLESCLLHWDLVSAQQIAAIIDRSFPQERDFHFWNIAITHLLATSSQSSSDKKKLYGTLAQKQIERAAQLAEQAGSAAETSSTPQSSPRYIQTEEEVLLLYDIVETHGTAADLDKIFANPIFGPLAQFRLGRKEPLNRAVENLRRRDAWPAVFELCKSCLSDESDDGQPNMLASDWRMWRQLIESAEHLMSTDAGSRTIVNDLVLKFANSKNLLPIYRRNVLLARVLAIFKLGPWDGDSDDLCDGRPASLRMRELVRYLDDQMTTASCFDDVKGLVETLDRPSMKYIAYIHLPESAGAANDPVAGARIRLLALKMQYLIITCPSMVIPKAGKQPNSECAICQARFDSKMCTSCMKKVCREAVALYKSAAEELAGVGVYKAEIEPEYAILISLCNIRLAFNRGGAGHCYGASSRLASPRHLVRALLILEHETHRTPKHGQISLLLVRLHLFLGSAHRAREIWNGLSVKRTIIDSLGPLFFDRLSIISPATVSPLDAAGWQLMASLGSHFSTSLRLRMPGRLMDAFEAGSYSSVLEIPKYMDRLRRSCTRAMSLVEEARAGRLLGKAGRELLTDPRFAEISDETRLVEVVDHGSFPSWECSSCEPIYSLVGIGPHPTNERFHLSLLSEAFYDVLNYKPPPAFKPSAAALERDEVFVLEMMARLGNSTSKFLGSAAPGCTPMEVLYFDVISLLSTLAPLCVENGMSEGRDVVSQVAESLRAALQSLQAEVSSHGPEAVESTVSGLMSVDKAAMLHETAAAVKLTTGWILSHRGRNERQSGKTAGDSLVQSKAVAEEMSRLQSATEEAFRVGQDWLKRLVRGGLQGGGFEAALRAWAGTDDDDGQVLMALIEDRTALQLVESWRLNVKGWQRVDWAAGR